MEAKNNAETDGRRWPLAGKGIKTAGNQLRYWQGHVVFSIIQFECMWQAMPCQIMFYFHSANFNIFDWSCHIMLYFHSSNLNVFDRSYHVKSWWIFTRPIWMPSDAISGLILDLTDTTLDRFEVEANMLVSSRLNCNEGEPIEYVSETLIQSAWPI